MKSHIFTIVAIDALVLIAWMMCVDDFRRMPMEQPQVQPATTSAVAVQSDFRRLRNVKVGNVVGQTSQERRVNCVIDKHSLELLEDKRQGVSSVDVSQLASDKNQVMDELLNQDQIPADYGTQMVALFRDKGQDVLTRDFAVQHIGLYAQALNRRGVYDSESTESRSLRAALFDAASETRTIIAAAAFRALTDMAAFDPHIDFSRFDARLAACAGDISASPAVRVMAVHLCGERRVKSAIPALEKICAASGTPEILRRSASYALSRIR